MNIKRFDFGTRYSGRTGVPDIIEKVGGRYVLYTDYAALAALTDAIANHADGTNEMLGSPSATDRGSDMPIYASPQPDHLSGAAKMISAPVPLMRDWPTIQAYIEEYVDDYEMVGESDNTYDPSTSERALIKDAIHGLLGESDFDALYHPQPPTSARPSVPANWDRLILAEIDRRFQLQGEENQYERLSIDDTQLGVEFVIEQVRTMLAATPPAYDPCEHSEHVRPADGVCVECGDVVAQQDANYIIELLATLLHFIPKDEREIYADTERLCASLRDRTPPADGQVQQEKIQ